MQSYDGTTTVYGYDTSGNPVAADALTSIQFPDGTHQFFTYDAEGRLAGSSQDGDADAYTYSYSLGEATVKDADGDATHFFFNEQGLLVKTIDPLGNVSFAAYNGNYNLTSATGPTGLVETFTYDNNGNLTASPTRSARPTVSVTPAPTTCWRLPPTPRGAPRPTTTTPAAISL